MYYVCTHDWGFLCDPTWQGYKTTRNILKASSFYSVEECIKVCQKEGYDFCDYTIIQKVN